MLLAQVRLPSPGSFFSFVSSSEVSGQCRLSVFAQPPSAIVCIDIGVHVESPKRW